MNKRRVCGWLSLFQMLPQSLYIAKYNLLLWALALHIPASLREMYKQQDIIDVTVIGAGPGGLFAVMEIVEKVGKDIKLLVIDKGKPPSIRKCNALIDGCVGCKICELISGGGGAGLFSDGKLVFDIYSGGHLEEIIPPNKKKEIERRIKETIETFAPKYLYKNPSLPENLSNCFRKQHLKFKPYPVIHIGSNSLRFFSQQLISYLQKRNVKFLFNTEVKAFRYDASSSKWIIKIVSKGKNQIIESKYLVGSVGKEGNFWFTTLIEKIGGNIEDNNTYMGVRIEINNSTAEKLYKISFDPKFYFENSGIKIKTHCFCRHGQILLLKYFDLPLAGGHTPYLEIDEQYVPEKFPNSNFAILYRDKTICTKEKALEVMRKINKITGGKLLVQRLGDYIKNVPTTHKKLSNNTIKHSASDIVPGQILDDYLPGFREIFISFLERMDSCIPGMLNPDNLLYFPAIEWWMRKVKVNNKMEVINLPNLYAVGDGSGWTQGVVQAAATGIIAGNDIASKLDNRGDVL